MGVVCPSLDLVYALPLVLRTHVILQRSNSRHKALHTHTHIHGVLSMYTHVYIAYSQQFTKYAYTFTLSPYGYEYTLYSVTVREQPFDIYWGDRRICKKSAYNILKNTICY